MLLIRLLMKYIWWILLLVACVLAVKWCLRAYENHQAQAAEERLRQA
jgi:hypothetical protein